MTERRHFLAQGFLFFLLAVTVVSAKTIDKTTIEQEVRHYIASHYPDVTVRSLSLSRSSISVPEQPYHSVIHPRSKTNRHLYLQYRVYVGKTLKETVEITAAIRSMVNRVIATHDIAKGEKIRKGDLTVVKKEDKGGRSYVTNLSEAVGLYAKQKIRKGNALKYYNLRPEYLVKKRQNVKLLYHSGAIRIELMGIALENGKKGDEIKVRNVSSGKVLQCRVVGENRVVYER